MSKEVLSVPIAQLTVTITNDRAQRSVLYKSADPSLNHLTVTVANYTSEAVQLTAGGADPTQLTMTFGRLVTAAEAAAAIVTPPTGWSATYVATGRFSSWHLKLTTGTALAAGASLSFALAVPSVSGVASAGNFEVEYENVGGLDDDFVDIQMFALDPPGATPTPRLPLSVGWMADTPAVVYVSPPGPSLITSSLGITLSNAAVDAQGAPTVLVTKPWGSTPPALLISFVTIPRPSPDDPMPNPGLNALTYDEYAQTFTFEVVSDKIDDWEIDPPTSSGALVWTLKPKRPEVLGPGASVEVWIKNMVTTLPPFVTALYIQYLGFPDHDDDYFVLHLQKSNPTPGILGFFAESSNIDVGSSARLCWSTLALDGLELSYSVDGTTIVKSYDNGDFALEARDYAVIPTADTTYTLTPYSGGQQLPSRQVTVSVNRLAIGMDLSALTVAQGGTVYLTWSVVVSDRDYCVLDPGGIHLPLTGSNRALTVPTTTTFSITAYNSKQNPPSVIAQTVVTVLKPQIDSFTLGPASPVDAGTPMTVAWGTSFSSARQLVATETKVPPNPVTTPLSTESGTLVVKPVNSSSYLLTLDGFEGPVQQTLVVTLNPVTIDHLALSASPVEPNAQSTLSWGFSRATGFTLVSSLGVTLESHTYDTLTTLAGSNVVSADQDVTFTMTVTGPDGPVSRQITLGVNSVKLSASAANWGIDTGPADSYFYHITWSTQFATRVSLYDGYHNTTQDVALNGSYTALTRQALTTTYKLTAWGAGHSPVEVDLPCLGPIQPD